MHFSSESRNKLAKADGIVNVIGLKSFNIKGDAVGSIMKSSSSSSKSFISFFILYPFLLCRGMECSFLGVNTVVLSLKSSQNQRFRKKDVPMH